MRPRAAVAAVAAVIIAFLVEGAAAQPRRRVLRDVPSKPARALPAASLENRFGVDAALRQVHSREERDVTRGLARLAAIGTPTAIDALITALDSGGAARSPRARLAAVRALARHARLEIASRALAQAMTASDVARTEGGGDFVQRTAALALAKSGTRLALAILGKSLRQEGLAARVAADALLAHPPEDLDPILRAPGAPTEVLVDVLERLGDQRAFHALRAFVRRGSPPIRARAAVALTRLGDFETIQAAERWSAHPELALRIAAAEIFAHARDSRASRLLRTLLADDQARDAALDIATRAPHAAPLGAIQALALGATQDRDAAIVILGRMRSDAAVDALEKVLALPQTAWEAAYALARDPTPAASSVVERVLANAATRSLGVRMAVARSAALGVRVNGLDDAVRALRSAPGADEQRLAAWADRGGTLERALVPDDAPTESLFRLLEAGGAVAPLAARVLAARFDEATDARVQSLLGSPDERLRAHAALGLGRARTARAVGALERAYHDEESEWVRAAIVRALAARTERARQRTLTLASDLDPSPTVRQLAKRALGGASLSSGTGASVLWVRVEGAVRGSVSIMTSDGAITPASVPQDGAIIVTGLPEGPVEVRVHAAETVGFQTPAR